MSDITKDVVLITDLGSVDPDDIFALILLTSLKNLNIKGVITNHHYADLRAKIAKLILTELGRCDIDVYQGDGITYNPNNKNNNKSSQDSLCLYNEKDREIFMNNNPLFPPFFGYPRSVFDKSKGEKEWFPDFMRGFTDFYDKNLIQNLKIKENGTTFLIELLKKYSPENRLLVVCIAPLHGLSKIPPILLKNMNFYVMGGGFEENIESVINGESTELNVPKAGYNWGIAPNITKIVLDNFNSVNEKINIISSSVVRKKDVSIKVSIYDKWLNFINNLHDSKIPLITRAIMRDWFYCNRGNKLTQHKNLCDPLTLFMAVNSELGSYLDLKTSIDNWDKYDHYINMIENNPIIKMENVEPKNTRLLYDFDNCIKYQIIKRLENILFPYPKKQLIDSINSVLTLSKKIQGNNFENSGNNFCIIEKDSNFKLTEIKNNIFIKYEIPIQSGRIIQIVGDCERFTCHGTKMAKKILMDKIEEGAVIQWGFTGYDNCIQKNYDTNYLVSYIIDKLNIPCVANIVDYHTILAIKKWGCSFSRRCNNFLLLHSENFDCKFGDDTEFSDSLCDSIVCFEGGAQSFLQCINCLLLGKKIFGLRGLRNKLPIKYFSSVEFLDLLKQNIGKVEIADIKKSYLDSCILFNPKKGDAGEKQKLFEEAWDKFTKYRLYDHLNELYSSDNIDQN